MDHSTYLWNRAFYVSQPCQMVWCLICVLLRYLSLPEVRGKGQNNDEHDDWSSSNQRWSRRDGDSPADSKERGSGGRTDGCGSCSKRTYHPARAEDKD